MEFVLQTQQRRVLDRAAMDLWLTRKFEVISLMEQKSFNFNFQSQGIENANARSVLLVFAAGIAYS